MARRSRGRGSASRRFTSARASRVFTAALAPEVGGGYGARLPLERPGLWVLRMRVERGDQVFTRTIDQDLERLR